MIAVSSPEHPAMLVGPLKPQGTQGMRKVRQEP